MFNHEILCLPFLPITMVHCVFLGSCGKTWQLVVPINLTSTACKEWPQCAFNQTQDTYSPNLRKTNNITCEKMHRSTSWWDNHEMWKKYHLDEIYVLVLTMFNLRKLEPFQKLMGIGPQMWMNLDSLNWWKLEEIEIKNIAKGTTDPGVDYFDQ